MWEPSGVYLNTASYGLPPRPAWEALQAALAEYRVGAVSWEPWSESTEGARAEWARMVGVAVSDVAVGATTSGLLGLVAASLPRGTRVLAPEIEFTSAIFPFLAQEHDVRFVPVAGLAEAIDRDVDVVVFSAVQSATGEVADLDAVAASAAHHGALTVVDASQACGWLPIDAARFDIVACHAYKWLMSPRGTAFMSVRPSRLGEIVPAAAGWYAAEDPFATYYRPPLRLASSARRLDVSPAWFSWVGTLPALRVVNEIGVEQIHEHDLRLANMFRTGLGLEPGDSAIVIVDAGVSQAELAAAGIMAAARDGKLRTSWHVYNTEDDVDRTLAVLRR